MTGNHRHRVDDPAAPARAAEQFATTRWSVVLAAGRRGSRGSRQALAELCEAYWYPVYAFIRRQGCPAADAQDVTQAFFCRLLEKNDLAAADRSRGRFRSFLLAAASHFLANQRDHAAALKRGGGRKQLPLDFDAAEGRYHLEPTDGLTPERLFERRWALTVLDRTLARLRQEHADAGKTDLFETLKGTLSGDERAAPHEELAQRLGMTATAVKTAVHRLRRRYRDALCAEIAPTLADAAGVDEEIRDLFAAVRS